MSYLELEEGTGQAIIVERKQKYSFEALKLTDGIRITICLIM